MTAEREGGDLDAYLRAKGLRVRPAEPILPTVRDGPFPLSFAQQRIWFVEQAQPGTSMYNMPECARIRGEFEPAAAVRAIEWLVGRHEAWRTTFAVQGGRPVQIVHPELPPEITFEGCPAGEAAARARLAVLCDTPFDLERGPLVRVHILALAPADHMLLLNVHHIVSDGWSTGLFVREFIHAYAAFVEGRLPSLPPPALQYCDYVAWQHQTLNGSAFEALVQRWSKLVGPPNGYAALAPDFQRPAGPDESGRFVMLGLSSERTQALNTVAQRLRATQFMLLSVAFKLALARLTGVWQLSLGVPVAGRDRRQLEQVVGLMANTLVLHSDLSGDPTLAEAVERERAAWIAAQAYQHVPFERLVERLGGKRSPGEHPFFQIMFILQNTPMPPVALPGAAIEFIAIGTRSVKFDMVFELYQADEGLRGWLGYLCSLFDEGIVTRLMDLFRAILEDMPGGDDRPLSRLGAAASPGIDLNDFLAPL